jgi:glutathionylspermidine synthase
MGLELVVGRDLESSVMKCLPWNFTPPEFSRLVKQFRFRHFGWDAFAGGKCMILPEAILLSRTEHEQVVRIAETVCAMLKRLEGRIHQDEQRLTQLGIPAALHSIIKAEPEEGLSFARYDLFPSPDGRWHLSEFNEDVPGGFCEASGLPQLLKGRLPAGKFEGGLQEAILEAFSGAEKVGLIFATGYSEDLQHMLLLESWLKKAGHGAALCAPDHLSHKRGRFRAGQEEIQAVFRFYPGEWMPLLRNLRFWQRHAPELRMMNPLRRLIRQSKLLFHLWLEPGFLEGPDLDLVKEHAPFSEPFSCSKMDFYAEERENWVLKQAFGRMGDSVVMGNLSTPETWSKALGQAAKSTASFTVQRRFEVAPLEFASGNLYPAIGVYLVNGRFAGYYSRVAPKPFLTHEAYHVATVVEDA